MAKNIGFWAAFAMVFLGCVAPAEVDNGAPTNAGQTEENTMGFVAVGPAPGGPFATVQCPDDGNPATAEDIRRSTAALLRNDQLMTADIVSLGSAKVDRVGDTMTGKLTITPTGATGAVVATAGVGAGVAAIEAIGDLNFPGISTSSPGGAGIVSFAGGTNGAGVETTGSGTGPGILSVGGSAGPGGIFTAGTGGNAHGLSATGHGTYAGIVGIGGASGPGVIASAGTAPTATAPTNALRVSGYASFTGADPNLGINPGADNVVHGMNITKAFGRAFLGGAPPYTFMDGYDVNATLTVTGFGTFRVTMLRAMADTKYSVFPAIHGAVGYGVTETNIAGRTTTTFELTVFDTATQLPGVGAAEYLDVTVVGRQ